MNKASSLRNVDYDNLDRAKNAFIAAGQKTLKFAEPYGFVPGDRLGASANIFSLDLKPFLATGADSLAITMLPECLGTADDARPDDLTDEQLTTFWYNMAWKTLSCITNDAASGGLQPILFSLYLPSATPETVFNEVFLDGFLSGIVDGCRDIGCVYFSGETPQLQSKMLPDTLDIAGATFAVRPPGAAEVSGQVKAGDQIVLLASSGPHENGYTMLRKLANELPAGYHTKLPSGQEYWEALSAPSVLYAPIVRDILAAGLPVHNFEPITGHGWQKLMRSSAPLRYRIRQALPVTEIFTFVEEQTGSNPADILNKFNYGAGFAVFTPDQVSAEAIIKIAERHNVPAIVAGEVEAAKSREVIAEPFDVVLNGDEFALSK